MKRIWLMVHGRREDAMFCAKRAVDFLQAAGVEVLAEQFAAQHLGVPPLETAVDAPDVILTLGGDGTLLRGAQAAVQWDAALLGINLGRVGFLAEAEPKDIGHTLQCLLDGQYTLDERILLDVEAGEKHYLALNDVVVSRGGYARLISMDAQVNGLHAARYIADGLIVATPTGSTGYSLSAGGPIVSPHVDCMVITPICAHSLQHRPCVVPGHAEITVSLGEDQEYASLQIDGQSCQLLTGGAKVYIRRAEKPIRLIRTKPAHFFQLVRDKLTEWSQ